MAAEVIDAEVIVAGAGPVGLMLAGELAARGVDTAVLERLPGPDAESRGQVLYGRTIPTLDRRGLLDRFLAAERELNGYARRSPPNGHIAGINGLTYSAPDTDLPAAAFVSQSVATRLLTEWSGELGATIHRGYEVVGFDQDDLGVTVWLGADAPLRTVRARYLVGCDGARSRVRKAAGIAFPGTDAALNTIDGEAEPTDPGTAHRFRDATRQAERYRDGRVFLAGDSAHIHHPVCGQGLDLGLQDAVNLGWKLAGHLAGWAPPGLLDTYHAERHPIGASFLAHTRAQLALLNPDDRLDPLRDLFAELLRFAEVDRLVSGKLTAADVRYDPVGPDAHPLAGRFAPDLTLLGGDLPNRLGGDQPNPLGSDLSNRLGGDLSNRFGGDPPNPLGGDQPRRFGAGEPLRLASTLHAGRPVLLDLAGEPAVHAAAVGWADRVTVARYRCPGRPDLAALLIRPDGYVAWAAGPHESPARVGGGLVDALRRWFGEPARPLATTAASAGRTAALLVD